MEWQIKVGFNTCERIVKHVRDVLLWFDFSPGCVGVKANWVLLMKTARWSN